MSATRIDVQTNPPPAVARPARWPTVAAVVTVLLILLAGQFVPMAWLCAGAALPAFFLGRRLGGPWVAVAAVALVPVIWWLWLPEKSVGAGIALGLTGAWWLVRFSDDPAPINGIVAGLLLGALALVHRFGAIGALVAAVLLSARLRPLWRAWPWLAGAGIGWWLTRLTPWF